MENESVLPSFGILKKWTNYVSGWQDRYFEIKNGNLLYFKSKMEKDFGCRGSLALRNITVTLHEFDECEFTVSIGNDIMWYLKAENSHQKELWTKSLKNYQNDSDYSSTSTKTHSRNASLSSVLLSDKKIEGSEKLFSCRVAELEAYRTMCSDQMTSIGRILVQANVPKQNILSLKATHLAMLNNINHIIELVKSGQTPMSQCTESKCCSVLDSPSSPMTPEVTFDQPEMEAAPSDSLSTIREQSTVDVDVTSDFGDEWHDADEHSSMGSLDMGVEARESQSPSPVKVHKEKLHCTTSFIVDDNNKPCTMSTKPIVSQKRHLPFGHYDVLEMPESHNLFSEVEMLANEQLKYALAGVDDGVWSLFAEDGPMRMYTREEQDSGGLPIDPLKATHNVKGVSALEFMHYFYDALYKKHWDHTLNDMNIVEAVSRDTVVLHQKHKTVWPAAPRESLFVSHIRRVHDQKRPGAHDLYIVCNKDVERSDVPLGSSSVRVGLKVSMVCETILLNPTKPLDELTRDDVECNVIYVSQVHPGGWVPVTALRHVYKKEYPKFLRTFTEFVLKSVRDRPLSI